MVELAPDGPLGPDGPLTVELAPDGPDGPLGPPLGPDGPEGPETAFNVIYVCNSSNRPAVTSRAIRVPIILAVSLVPSTVESDIVRTSPVLLDISNICLVESSYGVS